MRRPRKSPNRARGARKAIAVNQAEGARKLRAKPPLIEQFHLAVDRQLKSGYGTYEAAEKAALAIKKRYPLLQVTVYDTKEQRHKTIEQPRAGADPRKNASHLAMRRRTSPRRVAAGVGR
jgi:hypothetical protein